MSDRVGLHTELLRFYPNVYFQPPSNITMKYPCIVYNKTERSTKFGNDKRYLVKQGYQITLIEKDPESNMADNIEWYFQNCSITQYYTKDNLNHTTLTLYY